MEDIRNQSEQHKEKFHKKCRCMKGKCHKETSSSSSPQEGETFTVDAKEYKMFCKWRNRMMKGKYGFSHKWMGHCEKPSNEKCKKLSEKTESEEKPCKEECKEPCHPHHHGHHHHHRRHGMMTSLFGPSCYPHYHGCHRFHGLPPMFW